MLITVKPTGNAPFQVNIEPHNNVAELKQKIQEARDYAVADQKIFHSGKTLQDSRVLRDVNVKDRDVIVLMAKPAQAVKPQAPSTPSTAQTVPVPAPAVVPAAPVVSQAPPAILKEVVPPPSGSRQSANAPVQREEVPPPAKEIPKSSPQTPAPPQTASTPTPAPPPYSIPRPAPVNQLRNLAQLTEQQKPIASGSTSDPSSDAKKPDDKPLTEQFRDAIAQNPAMFQLLAQVVATQNSALAERVREDPDLLLAIILRGIGSDEDDDSKASKPKSDAQSISVTQEEYDALKRLESLGFSSDAVVQAYFAFEKDEALAANFLFENS